MVFEIPGIDARPQNSQDFVIHIEDTVNIFPGMRERDALNTNGQNTSKKDFLKKQALDFPEGRSPGVLE